MNVSLKKHGDRTWLRCDAGTDPRRCSLIQMVRIILTEISQAILRRQLSREHPVSLPLYPGYDAWLRTAVRPRQITFVRRAA